MKTQENGIFFSFFGGKEMLSSNQPKFHEKKDAQVQYANQSTPFIKKLYKKYEFGKKNINFDFKCSAFRQRAFCIVCIFQPGYCSAGIQCSLFKRQPFNIKKKT